MNNIMGMMASSSVWLGVREVVDSGPTMAWLTKLTGMAANDATRLPRK